MSDDSISTTELPPIGDLDTEPVPAVDPSWGSAGSPSPESRGSASGDSPEGDDEWPARSPRPGLRLKYPTAVLVALLIGAGGLWGGAALQRSHGTGTTAGSSAFSRLASSGFNFNRGTGSGSRSGFPGLAGSSAAAGTVTVIEGDVLYVTTASGGLVKVILGKSTTYTRDATSTKSGLRPGDTVIVQGTKAKSGTVSATSVADTAAGVTPAG